MKILSSGARRRMAAGGLLTAAALVAVGCSSSEPAGDPTSASGGTLRVALTGTINCIDPWQVDTPAEMNAMRQMSETLTWIDPDTGELLPWLAESWEVNEDATAFTFTLQEGVTFSDGTPLTAEVMAANYDVASGFTASTRLPSYFGGYSGTDVVDDLTFTVNFESPNASFLNRTASQFMTVLGSATLESTPEERCAGYVATGPFVLDTYATNQEMVLTAREDYDWAPEWAGHTGRAIVDEIVFSIVPESSSRIGLLTSGQVDIAQAIEPQDFAAAESAGATIDTRMTPGFPSRLHSNTQAVPLDELAVRAAISYYIDRDEINTVVYDGHNTPATFLLTPNVPGSADLSDIIRFDPDQGDTLLENSGWEKNADGVWEKNAETLALHITASSPYSATPATLELLQQQLQAAGLVVTFSDWTGDFLDLVNNHQYQLLYTNTTDIDGDSLRGQLSPLNGNRMNLAEDDPIVEMLAEQNTIGDADERNELLGEIQEYVVENGYQIPIMPVVQYYGVSENTTGVFYDVESRLVLYGTTLAG